ncbi:MAG: gliding motility lipoprotein GldD [Bacteroidetes bacterium]|nr:MAG: gliding motility lipoprotein GldD [Bacteroidota bacterium]
MTLSYKLIIALCGVIIFSCSPSPVPRPKGYFRIELPEPEYIEDSPMCGPSFKIPVYSFIENVSSSNPNSCWFNIRFPDLNARLHCTSIVLDNNLELLIKDAQELVFSHDLKASGISRTRVYNDLSNIESRGVLYHLEGPVATPIQFFLTDSTEHFLRGSLYFDNRPNADSTAPVISRLIIDVEHLMKSVTWE